MNRRAHLRDYWNQRLPQYAWFYLVDAAKYVNRGLDRPLISRRSLQRRAREGTLKVFGGSERAIREYKVRREDLVEFLVDQDLITGAEPAPRVQEGKPEPPPAKTKSPPRPKRPRHVGQRSLFEE